MAKPSEDTLTTLFQELLLDLNLEVEAFPVWETPIGIRKPDLLLNTEKLYPLEAKLSDADLIKDMIKVQNDYFKYKSELNIGGAFLLRHPKSLKKETDLKIIRKKIRSLKYRLILMFPQDDERQFEIIDGKAKEIAKIIFETVNYKRIVKTLEVITSIDILRKSTKYMDDKLKDVKMNLLISTMGGTELFKDIMDIDIKKANYKSIRLAISFFVLSQLLFYHVIATTRNDLPPLDDIKYAKELKKKYYKKILDINYRAIFGVDIISHLPDSIVPSVNTIIYVLKCLKPENIKGDLIGTIFHDLIPQEIRKRVAAYYTSIIATEFLASFCINDSNISVADLSCGSGGLLVAAYRRKKKLIEKKRRFSQNDHTKFLEEDLVGIDIMPFASNIASGNLSLQSPQFKTNEVNIGLWDSTDLIPGDTIPEFAELKYMFGTATIDRYLNQEKVRRIPELAGRSSGKLKLKKYELLLMNPPFTRQERLSPKYKALINERFKKYKGIYNDVMGLHGVFILLGDKFLQKKGRMGLVLPASLLARESFNELRKFLCEKYTIQTIIFNSSKLNFSESTLWREILLIIKKEIVENNDVNIVRLTDFPENLEEIYLLAENIKKNEGSDKYHIKSYNQRTLQEMNDWSSITIFSDLFRKIYDFIKSNKDFSLFGENFDCIRSDLENFKTKSKVSCFIQNIFRENTQQCKEKWVASVQNSNKIKLKNIEIEGVEYNAPNDSFRRAMRTTSNLRNIKIDDKLGFLLVKSFKDYKNLFLRYITSRDDVKEFKTKEFEKILNNFNKRKSRLHLNRRLYLGSPGTSLVSFCSETEFIGVDTWGFTNISTDDAKILSLWLNSSLGIMQLLMLGVAIEGNWMKIHKYMIKRFYIPSIDILKKNYTNELNDLYDQVLSADLPSLLVQLNEINPIRKKIDKFFIEKIKYDYSQECDSIDEFLELIQTDLLFELKVLCSIN